MNKSTLILILISILNPWIWKIFQQNVLLSVLLISLSFLLFNLIWKSQFSPGYLISTLFVFAVLSVMGIWLGYDQGLKKLESYEEIKINDRHKYYAKELGNLFLNKYSLNFYKNYNPYFYKFQSNFFSVLDPNLYFFASHPRERAGINEFEKFPSIYLIFFIFGIIYILQFQARVTIVYLIMAAFISGFISPGFGFGPFLFFPFVTTLTSLGIIYLSKEIHLLKS